MKENIDKNRAFMQSPDFSKKMADSDQKKGVKKPPHSKDVKGKLITLPLFDDIIQEDSYEHLLENRRSVRTFADEPISQKQLAFLLWSIHGVQEFRGADNYVAMRPSPSGGARHPFEIYIAVHNVEALTPGFYRYASLENPGEKQVTLEFVQPFSGDYKELITDMLVKQSWAKDAGIVLFFSCLPYRAEWRYNDMAHRVALIDLGHAGQNAMLSATALGLGSCCIAAYDQGLCDNVLGFNGYDEFTVYAIPVGIPQALVV